MGSNIATENTYFKVEPKLEREPKMLMATPPSSVVVESEIPNPTSVSNIRIRGSNADGENPMRRSRINSSKISGPQGKEIYKSNINDGQMRVIRSSQPQIANNLEGLKGKDLRVELLNLQEMIKPKRLIKESIYYDESYSGNSQVEAITQIGHPSQLDLGMGEIAKHGTAQVKTYIFHRPLIARIQAH